MSPRRRTLTPSARLLPAGLALAAAAALTACSSEPAAPAPGTGAATSPAAPAASTSSSAPTDPSSGASEPPRLLAYAGGESAGVEVRVPSDLDKLDGAPEPFRVFIGQRVAELQASATCDRSQVGVTVEFLRTDGYAVGGVDDCGGYAALWAVVDGAWAEVEGTQDSWSCEVLARYRFPSELVGDTCYDYTAQEELPYSQP